MTSTTSATATKLYRLTDLSNGTQYSLSKDDNTYYVDVSGGILTDKHKFLKRFGTRWQGYKMTKEARRTIFDDIDKQLTKDYAHNAFTELMKGTTTYNNYNGLQKFGKKIQKKGTAFLTKNEKKIKNALIKGYNSKVEFAYDDLSCNGTKVALDDSAIKKVHNNAAVNTYYNEKTPLPQFVGHHGLGTSIFLLGGVIPAAAPVLFSLGLANYLAASMYLAMNPCYKDFQKSSFGKRYEMK